MFLFVDFRASHARPAWPSGRRIANLSNFAQSSKSFTPLKSAPNPKIKQKPQSNEYQGKKDFLYVYSF